MAATAPQSGPDPGMERSGQRPTRRSRGMTNDGPVNPLELPLQSIHSTSYGPSATRRSSRRMDQQQGDYEGHYPCPFHCGYIADARATRAVHMRLDHPGMTPAKVEIDVPEPHIEIVDDFEHSSHHEVIIHGSRAPVQPPPVPQARISQFSAPYAPETDGNVFGVGMRKRNSGAKRGRGRPKKEVLDVDDVSNEEVVVVDTVDSDPDYIDYKKDIPYMEEKVTPSRSKRKHQHEVVHYEELHTVEVPHSSASSPSKRGRGRPKANARRSVYGAKSPRKNRRRVHEEIYQEGDEIVEEVIEEEVILDDETGHKIYDPDSFEKMVVINENGEEVYVSAEDLDIQYHDSGSDADEINVEVDHNDIIEEPAQPQQPIFKPFTFPKETRAKPVRRPVRDYDQEPVDPYKRHRAIRNHPDGDPNGKYPCYIEGCNWRGNYRSVRCTHMRNVHPDWVRPPHFVLNRIAKDGTIIPANDTSCRYACFVRNCPWRGNYRASRSSHMKKVHKDWVPKRTRAQPGGFVANGAYHCHVEECGWRGMSRSTRAVHMKREHPGFINPVYTTRSIICTDCGASLTSHKLFVDHMVVEHKIGGIVQREFTDVRDYEDWFEAVQDSFSIDFVKKMGVKTAPSHQILYLYCARSGTYASRANRIDLLGMYEPKNTRTRRPGKCGRNCAAFLRVMHWNDGRLNIIGCVEHTGHRLGTQLLRLSAIEREAMDEYLYMMDENTPLDHIVDRLREVEGFTADGFVPTEQPAEFTNEFILDPSEKESLRKLLMSEDHPMFSEENTFEVRTPVAGSAHLSLGIMNEQMKQLYAEYASKGVCIEEVRLVLGVWDLRIFLVLVMDDQNYPRVACVYLCHQSNKEPIFVKLRSVWSGEIATVVTDNSPEYPALIQEYFATGSEPVDHQIAEWHLMAEWAANLEVMVQNRVDKYGLICVLRRVLRTADPTVFDATISELFDALREMQLDDAVQYVDVQLEPEFLKKWTPLARNPLTDHNNPTLEFACRMLRDRFLSCDQCSRIDEYLGLLATRMNDYNSSGLSPVYATRELEPPRELPQVYMQEVLEEDEPEADNWPVYQTPNTTMVDRFANSTDMEVPSTSGGTSHFQESMKVPMKVSKAEDLDHDAHDEIAADTLDMEHEEEVVEEIIEEEVVDFDEEQILAAALGEDGTEDHGETSGDAGEGGSGAAHHEEETERGDAAALRSPPAKMNTRERVEKKQKLINMMQLLQEKLQNMADDDCIEIMENNLEQVVSTLQSRKGPPKIVGRTQRTIVVNKDKEQQQQQQEKAD